MEWFTKLIEVLKIPLVIFLPSTWLFSGIMIFASEKLLLKMNLLTWSKENGFIFGLLFLTSSCLMLIYIVKYICKLIKTIIWKLTFKRRTMVLISKLSPTEISIIAKLYKSIGYTCKLDFTHPCVRALSNNNLIFSGGTQIVSLDDDDGMRIKFMLQPFVSRTLEHYEKDLSRKIAKLEEKIKREKKSLKKEKYNSKLDNFRKIYELLFDRGIIYDG